MERHDKTHSSLTSHENPPSSTKAVFCGLTMTIERRLSTISTAQFLRALYIACLYTRISGFVPLQAHKCLHRTNQVKRHETSDGNTDEDKTLKCEGRGLTCGLLISSWTDGVLQNLQAQAFLQKGLATSLLSGLQRKAEAAVETSVSFSPCNGPNVDALTIMESIDKTIDRIQQDRHYLDVWLEQMEPHTLNLKLVYIPTAMYAVRADSDSTPGKQRQRARADGKKRRTQVIQMIRQLFLKKINILAVTLDLDDGSVKQPEGSEKQSHFPTDGKEALREWAPHLIYVEGGNTFWLHHCMIKGDWEEVLLSAIRGAVYCGKSAGAILAGRTLETATWKRLDDPSIVPSMETYQDWKGAKGLDLVQGASFFPHMSDEWRDLTLQKQQSVGEVYFLRDEDVCLVQGKSVSIVSADSFLSQ